MPMQTINLGTYANSGTGDDLRTAFEKVNANFQFLDATSAVTAENTGIGAQVFKEKTGDNLILRSITSSTGITVTQNANDITIGSIIDITRDTAPELGGNLVLGGNNITGTGNISITGAATLSGDVAVNGGDLTTTATAFNLVNTNATTVNFAGAANFLNIGKSGALTTVASELQVNDDVVIANNGRLKTTNTSGYLFNETANYVFMGQSATTVQIGSSSGWTNFGNDVSVARDITSVRNVTLTGSLTVTAVDKIVIPGGLNGYVLSTNGSGGLNWIAPPTSGAGGGLDFGTFTSPEGFTLDLGSF